MENFDLPNSSYSFSGMSTDGLDDVASEFTLVTIALDESSSVTSYRDDINKCMGEIITACSQSPRAENLMLRVITFGTTIREIHGFKLLSACNPGDYSNAVNPGGMTALADATLNAIEAVESYGKKLIDDEYETNALMVVVTDGADNNSTNTVDQSKDALSRISLNEQIDGGLHSILVGVGAGGADANQLDGYLQNFKDTVGFAQYVPLADSSPSTLAKLANFISRSISSQSQALATGGPSKSLSF